MATSQPYGYLDTTGGTGNSGNYFIVAADALAIINFISAFGTGLPGPVGEVEAAEARLEDELFALLADDLFVAAKRRRG